MPNHDPEVSVTFNPLPPLAERGGRHGAVADAIWREDEFRDWPPLEWPDEPVRPKEPSAGSKWLIRGLILGGIWALAAFFSWLLEPEIRGDAWLFWVVIAAFAYKSLWWLVEWMNYARPKVEPAKRPTRKWTVDVLTTACPGEPRCMILRTLLAMKAIRYPHTDWLCDEGDDPVLREACEALGIRHVTRAVKTDAKAGNINNALAQATGEIVVVLDPDHEPSPYLLDRLLGYFDEPHVGFVQSVQAYRNQADSMVADGAAKQTYLFYGPMMIGMHAYGTTQAIGANCVFRRSALDSIGGHAPGLAEDMHTTMRLYARGWQSVYVPEILTRGLVPSTLSAYCKQQVKWACGSMELLIKEMPRLWRGMTWPQRLHYTMAPLYFWRGLFGLIHILVPIVCLVLGTVPLRIDLREFLAMYLPVVLLGAVIRQRAQQWTIEKSEVGAHLLGGLLGAGCWWVFLRGVLCAVFHIRLPYIPTPKDSEAHDSWGLAMPNLIAAAASVGAVAYGLYRDWTPYSLMMAAFALWNAAQLTFVAALGQQRTLQRAAYFLSRRDWIAKLHTPLAKARFHIQCGLLRVMRERPLVVAFLVFVAALLFHLRPHSAAPHDPSVPTFKDTGGFYVGVRFREAERGKFPHDFDKTARALGVGMRVFPVTLRWAPEDAEPLPLALLREARLHGAVPLITWEPRAATFPKFRTDPKLGADKGVLSAVLAGAFDDFLIAFAEKLRDFGEPVLIRFAPDPDNPARPWSPENGTTAAQYTEAWEYVASVFNEVGASNVGWMWQPWKPGGMATHLPPVAHVDWIGLSMLNLGTMDGGTWREFADLYAPFRAKIQSLRLPVMLTGFGSTSSGGDRNAWLQRALAKISADCPEIRGLVVPEVSGGWFADDGAQTLRTLAGGLAGKVFRGAPASAFPRAPEIWAERPRTMARSSAIRGTPGNYTWLVDGQPFYVRGIAYNPGHDWRDGYIPLTRRELESDLARVHAMGANTVRRYGNNWYDRNVLRIADEAGLRVLMGFWFEQQVDYRANSAKLAAYERQIESTVLARRGEHSVIAWSLGNEVWGLLKHHYSQPYLTEVRHAHVDFVERLAHRIHELDPQRPVFTAHEHSSALAGTLHDFSVGAPSLDFTGINSYYEERISRLRDLTARFDPTRPYLISEFGPDGYWESSARRTDFGGLIEPTTAAKARSYERAWAVHTEPNRGANVGGVAYCWRDRFEATATWFGLTDMNGRPKPACLALEQLWTGRKSPQAPRVQGIAVPDSIVEPGESLLVRAAIEPPRGTKLTYRWRIASQDFDFKTGKVERGQGSRVAQLTMPKQPGMYRIYFTATDGHTVDEANFPVQVTGDPARPQGFVLDWSAIPFYRRIVGP